MDKEEIEIWKKTLSISSVVLIPAAIIFLVLNPVSVEIGGHNTEKVRKKIKKELYQEYGEEFVVDRIGSRSSRGEEFYQARIYPKSIIGTEKEGDEYYYGKASVGKELFGLGGVADTYGEIKRSLEIENMLLPKAKELFGKLVRLKVEQRYEKKNENGYFVSYLNPSLEEVFRRMEKEPDQHRIKLNLDVYVFDRIQDEKEKKKRREEIFRFVQYLKEKGLFEYLEMAVTFIDERVLAPSYEKYKDKVDYSDKVKEEIQGETVRMPPMKLRKRMSKKLQKEVEEINEKRLLTCMKKIQKEDLDYEDLEKYNATHYGLIYSVGILKVRYGSSYKKYKKNKKLEHYYYKNVSDVKIGRNLEYIYIN